MSTTVVSQHRNRGAFSRASVAYVERAKAVIDELADYWPLTLRQVYYQLVAAGQIENNLREYNKLSRMLTKARLSGLVSWDAIEDRSRRTLPSAGWLDKSDFITQEVGRFLTGYRRDLLQSQPMALELWTEKDTLAPLCHQIAFSYCVPVIVARGFSSVSYVHECRKRVEENEQEGKSTLILYFGDLDPSGWAMLPTMLETLQHEMELGGLVSGERCALTPEQVAALNLPHNPDALKVTDTRAGGYMERFGMLAVELDALPPATLQEMIGKAIKAKLVLSHFDEERERQAMEIPELSSLRKEVHSFIRNREAT